MEVLETQWTDADAAKSLNIATDLITGNPDIAGFFSAAAPIASGIAQAAIAKGMEKTLKIITFDPSPEILPLFDDGTIQAIIAQDPYQMGYQGVAAIDAFINGQTIEAIRNTMVSALRDLQAEGDILGYKVSFERDQNNPNNLRLGKFTVNFAAEEAPVLRQLGIRSSRYLPALDTLLDNLIAQLDIAA